MTNILNLIKIYTKQTFTNYTNFISKNKKSHRKKVASIAFILLIFAYIMFYIGMTLFQQMDILQLAEMENYILLIGFIFSNLILFLIATYEIQGQFFKVKDFNLITSLPVKSFEIVISKFISILIFSYIYQAIIYIPTFITWLIHCEVTFTGISFLVCGFLFLPFFTLILSSIIAFLINFITSKTSQTKVINLIFLFIFLILIMTACFFINSELINVFISFGEIPPLIYVLLPTSVFLFNAILHSSLLWFFIFLVLSLGSALIVLFILSFFYLKINQNFGNNKTIYKIKKVDYRPKSLLHSLLNIEIKNYFNITVYVFNSIFGAILLLLASIAGTIIFYNFPEMLAEICNAEIFYMMIIVIFSLSCALSITTSSSISIEGKSYYIKKSLPIDYKNIILSKILLNVVVVAPFLFFGFLILLPVFIDIGMSIFAILSLLIVPLITLFTISTISLMVNLWYPKLNFTTETEVVKQSISVLISTFLGMVIIGIFSLLYMTLLSTLSIYLYVAIYTIFMIFIEMIFISILKSNGKKLYLELN